MSDSVEIRGVTYPSLAAAARALGVKYVTVHRARALGRLHRCGIGRAGVEPMAICIRGREFENAEAAARAFKVTKGAIYTALHRGSIDRIGLPPRCGLPRAQEFVIGPLRYPSKRSASIALGFAPEYVSNVLRNGGPDARASLLRAAMALAARQEAAKRRMAA